MLKLAFSTSHALRLHVWRGASARCFRTVRAEPLSYSRVRFPMAMNAAASTTETEEVDPGAVPGTSLRVLKYPHPLLRAPNSEFAPDELGEARKIAKEMLMVMYASRGIGLAAPQVGVNRRLMVFNVTGDPKKWTHESVLVNPRIVASSKASDVEAEACLSFPNMSGPVRRPEWVKVEALRLTGRPQKFRFEGWKARVFQHEYDHLDGVMYIDRLEEEGKAEVQERLQELVKNYEAEPFQSLPPAL